MLNQKRKRLSNQDERKRRQKGWKKGIEHHLEEDERKTLTSTCIRLLMTRMKVDSINQLLQH